MDSTTPTSAKIQGTWTASAAKRGRNADWPYVPIVKWQPADGHRGYTTQPRGKAFATRDEAVAYAERYIAVNKMREAT